MQNAGDKDSGIDVDSRTDEDLRTKKIPGAHASGFWAAFYPSPPPLFTSPSTPPLIQVYLRLPYIFIRSIETNRVSTIGQLVS
ncbi:hypothetical protein J6TS7_03960 [Paenibacillus dendritiformis]|nr:hypothetical protein J6TS7_03960 [Paenibacillus dendritiformis]